MKITILDKDFTGDPEAVAMLQAFYSRSKKPIAERLVELIGDDEAADIMKMSNLKRSLNSYYVGYGHDSIGQVARMTLFIEDVSLLAAKTIQHNALYDGQESSTRYIKFGDANEPVISPLIAQFGNTYQSAWIDVYNTVREAVKEWLVRKNLSDVPVNLGPDRTIDDAIKENAKVVKACEAKAFDVARAFLPAGVTTNLSWHVSFANYNREIPRLLAHPLLEIRQIAYAMQEQVKRHYPAIYKDFDLVENQGAVDTCSERMFHYDTVRALPDLNNTSQVEYVMLNRNIQFPHSPRLKYARVPHEIHTASFMRGVFWIDYASWRDVQRHRPLSSSSPKLAVWLTTTQDFGDLRSVFGDWYIDMLVECGVYDKVVPKISKLLIDYHNLLVDNEYAESFTDYAQYYLPIGLKVPVTLSGYLGDWLYVAELRTGETVHPTVRQWADDTWHKIETNMREVGHHELLRWLQPNVKPFNSTDHSRVSLRRAEQDIVKK